MTSALTQATIYISNNLNIDLFASTHHYMSIMATVLIQKSIWQRNGKENSMEYI